MTILVTGATDNVGSEVTCQLPARNPDVKIMTRRPDQIDTSTGIPGVHGHFEDPHRMRLAALRFTAPTSRPRRSVGKSKSRP